MQKFVILSQVASIYKHNASFCKLLKLLYNFLLIIHSKILLTDYNLVSGCLKVYMIDYIVLKSAVNSGVLHKHSSCVGGCGQSVLLVHLQSQRVERHL